ncbi:glutathione peroxidase [Bordetella trematum]|uniref:Glutaredoxin n=1 Tax=Bordetella trematum TaxID=123899 RepID=A0A157M617_9BORD|nr:glutathione peroxidase [Bordetella trematum]AUL47115.1 glutathione peroxidase [Bordetella trematum]AZR93964.1 glutathione peroxidase [Bordetella trematum]NNH18324.1 glutathione peroxidase [Bordetella trematum]QIM72501.1 glutathione peroxidase [Bordetella trematum]SAH85172.1 glutaredoxin [Bordetella trematum]
MLQNREGQRVPNVTFPVRDGNSWKKLTTDELFKNRTVVVFSLPGAFTPTCSSTHLPRYNELAQTFFDNGVDEIVCVSVNDTFVMNEWAKDQECGNITMVPDGNTAFTAGMGMLVDKEDLGFGKRSWRYSMLVKDGVVEKMFIEPEKEGDPFEVSDADTMLNYLAPNAKKPEQVVVFAKDGCPFCIEAKALLRDKGFDPIEIPLDNKVRGRVLGAVSGKGTAPQVFISGKLIGGLDELKAHFA